MIPRAIPRVSLLLRRPPVNHQRLLTTIGIRRENPKRIWERRAPLTPDDVGSLLETPGGFASGDRGKEKEVAVQVESCRRRCFPDEAYSEVGAKVVPALTPDVNLVLGIKEPPVQAVRDLIAAQPGKKRTWMVFSHTHKGQRYNTELLSSFMDKAKSQTLVDYELMTAPTDNGDLKRVAAFGWYAGAVGAGEALSMTGLALLHRGIHTPLLHLRRPYNTQSLDNLKLALQDVSRQIKESVTPLDPIVIGITGRGNVAEGARAMLNEAHVQWIDHTSLHTCTTKNTIYACLIPPQAYFTRKDGKPYSREDYYTHPEAYISKFGSDFANRLTVWINAAGWQAGFPRIMSDGDMREMLDVSGGEGKQSLVGIQDITCDLKGGLEFIDQHTTIDEPYYKGPGGILISAIDILPTELPVDASKHFSSKILPFVKAFISKDPPPAQMDTINRAKIVADGELTPKHAWLGERVQEFPAKDVQSNSPGSASRGYGVEQKKKVLLLGSGLVAGPAVEVFAGRKDVQLSIASNNLQEAAALVKGRDNISTVSLDVANQEALKAVVESSDVVVSLLPAPMHTKVAEHCIALGKHLVTASYISPEMKALHEHAVTKDVLLLGECGLDPGIDSMAAMRILDRVKREKMTVKSFTSWCGGLPELSASNVPFRYKFSWSPKAVLTASTNDASFIENGMRRDIPGQELLRQKFPKVELWDDLPLEGLANRDSLPYAEKYGLGPLEKLEHLFRGTLRYRGFADTLEPFRKLGFLDSSALSKTPSSWGDFANLMISRSSARGEDGDQLLETLDRLLADRKGLKPPRATIPIDLMADLMSQTLAYNPGERDLTLLHHRFGLSGTGDAKRIVTASLKYRGNEDASAMSITVGKTLAFAALRVLDGQITARGVQGPYEREVWEGVLDRLEDVGVKVEEKWQ